MTITIEELHGGAEFHQFTGSSIFVLPVTTRTRVWYFAGSLLPVNYDVYLPDTQSMDLKGWLYYMMTNRTDEVINLRTHDGVSIGIIPVGGCMWIGLMDQAQPPDINPPWLLHNVQCVEGTDDVGPVNILAFGGEEVGAAPPGAVGGTTDVYRYDIVSDNWSLGTVMPADGLLCSACEVFDVAGIRTIVRMDPTGPVGTSNMEYLNNTWITKDQSIFAVQHSGMTSVNVGPTAPGTAHEYSAEGISNLEMYSYTPDVNSLVSGPPDDFVWNDSTLATSGTDGDYLYAHFSRKTGEAGVPISFIWSPTGSSWINLPLGLWNGQQNWAVTLTGIMEHAVSRLGGNATYRYVVPYAIYRHQQFTGGPFGIWQERPTMPIRGQEMGCARVSGVPSKIVYGQGGQFGTLDDSAATNDPYAWVYDELTQGYTRIGTPLWKNRQQRENAWSMNQTII